MQEWFVYIARTEDGYLYTGISNDVEKRVIKHNSGLGSKFARMHPNFRLVYRSKPLTKSGALKRELQIKGWSRLKKEQLISGQLI